MTERDVSGWAIGWTWFAAVMMWLLGAFNAMAGLVAIANDEFYAITPEYVFKFDVTTWGWINLILGIVVFVAGVYLLSGQVWARTVGVIMAIVAILANFAWLPWYPVWSILMIAVGGFVIWALTVHGHDIEAA
jgi:hypothetical protein